jgi:hypothetical protein
MSADYQEEVAIETEEMVEQTVELDSSLVVEGQEVVGEVEGQEVVGQVEGEEVQYVVLSTDDQEGQGQTLTAIQTESGQIEYAIAEDGQVLHIVDGDQSAGIEVTQGEGEPEVIEIVDTEPAAQPNTRFVYLLAPTI